VGAIDLRGLITVACSGRKALVKFTPSGREPGNLSVHFVLEGGIRHKFGWCRYSGDNRAVLRRI
jgi:hypothetical protein